MSESSNLRFTDGEGIQQTFESKFVYSDIFLKGSLYVFGANVSDSLGTLSGPASNKVTPVTTFSGGSNWKSIASGYQATYGVKLDGTLWSWGTYNGQSAVLAKNTIIATYATPSTTIAGGSDWSQVSAAYGTAAAVKRDGSLWTWGILNGSNVNYSTLTRFSSPVTTFAGGNNWKEVNVGDVHCAAIKTDGSLWVWGVNDGGQLGTNDRISRSTPVTTFAGGNNWKQVIPARFLDTISFDGNVFNGSSPESNTVAVKTDGTLWSWGNNYLGQLGQIRSGFDYERNGFKTPRLVSGNYKWISVGGSGSGIANSQTPSTLVGNVFNWGAKSELGISASPTEYNRMRFVSVPVTTSSANTEWVQVSSSYYTWRGVDNQGKNFGSRAAISKSGQLYLWGYVYGVNSTGPTEITFPQTIFGGGNNWRQVSYGVNHGAAVKTDGTLWVWGLNYGPNSLGINGADNRPTPVTTFAGGTNWKQVSCSLYNTLAIKTDGTLWVWGTNYGMLGTNDSIDKSTPVTTFAGGNDWKQVSSSDNFNAAIKNDGTLWTWGDNFSGSLGTGDTTNRLTPVTTFSGGTNWDYVACGQRHVLATKTDGTLWSWGSNSFGVLGFDDTINRSIPTNVPHPSGKTWKTVASQKLLLEESSLLAGSAAVKNDGTLWVWGKSFFGTGSVNYTVLATPVTTFSGGTNWRQVASSGSMKAAIKTDGTLWVWGTNQYASLGNNGNPDGNTPVTTFAGGTNWKQVACGYFHTAAIKTDGTLWTWGTNTSGQLGNNNTFASPTPITTFAGGTNWKQVTCSKTSTLAIKTDGTLWGWGGGNTLGINAFRSVTATPVTTISGGNDWKSISATWMGETAAAIKNDGSLWVWGANTHGQMGININAGYFYSPYQIYGGGNDWRQCVIGERHAAAVKTDGTLWTWGANSYGQLGNRISNSFTVLTPITTFSGGKNWSQVYVDGDISNAFDYFTYGLKDDGSLWTWGGNGQGQLANNTLLLRSVPVTTFAGGNNWYTEPMLPPTLACDASQSSEATNRSMAIDSEFNLWSWGENKNGILGVNDSYTSMDRITPTHIGEGTYWRKAYTSYYNTAAISRNGELYFWGLGINGSIPINTSSNIVRVSPAQVHNGGNNWKDVKLGRNFGSATKTDGTLWMWGWNGFGQLGTNDTTNRLTPVTTFSGGSDWIDTSLGYAHSAAYDYQEDLGNVSAAIIPDGEQLFVWDYNFAGQNYSTPCTYTWVCPPNVTSVSVVCIGGGGGGDGGNGQYAGGGGELRYKNNIPVIPGQSYTVVVGNGGISGNGGYHTQEAVNAVASPGANSYFISTSTVRANGGGRGTGGSGGIGDGGGNGGTGGSGTSGSMVNGAGGGGAGGYSGTGGNGSASGSGSAGTGGGGGGGAVGQGNGTFPPTYNPPSYTGVNPGYGGGTNVYGEGANGSGGTFGSATSPGRQGSGTNEMTQNYGGGGSMGIKTTQPGCPTAYCWSTGGGYGGGGAVRIIWGQGREFPSTNTQQL